MKAWLEVFLLAPEAFVCLAVVFGGAVLHAGRTAWAFGRKASGRARLRRLGWPQKIVSVLLLSLTGCAHFGQQPRPVGEPGPVACIGAQSALLSWEELDRYMRAVLEAQQAYSCGPFAPTLMTPAPNLTPLSPSLRPAVPALR